MREVTSFFNFIQTDEFSSQSISSLTFDQNRSSLMELPSDEFAILQLYRTAKIQLGGLLPNIATLTLMSFTCHNKLVAVTQGTESFVQPQLGVSYLEDVQMIVKTEENANVNKPLNLSSSSTSSSESEDEVFRKNRKKEKKCKVSRSPSSDPENDEPIRKVTKNSDRNGMKNRRLPRIYPKLLLSPGITISTIS